MVVIVQTHFEDAERIGDAVGVTPIDWCVASGPPFDTLYQGFLLLEIKSVTVRYLQAYLVTVIILDITVRKSR